MFKSDNTLGGVGNPVLVYGDARWNGNYVYDIETLAEITKNYALKGGIVFPEGSSYNLSYEPAEYTDERVFMDGHIKKYPMQGFYKIFEIDYNIVRLSDVVHLSRTQDNQHRWIYNWFLRFLDIYNRWLASEGTLRLYFYPMGKPSNKYEVIFQEIPDVNYPGKVNFNKLIITLKTAKIYQFDLQTFFERKAVSDSNPPRTIFRDKTESSSTSQYGLIGYGYFESKYIKVTSPNHGGTYQIGNTFTITWTHDVSVTSVDIYISLDNGVTWSKKNMMAVPASNKTFSWTVSGSTSNTCMAKVQDNSNSNKADITDRNFIIQSSS